MFSRSMLRDLARIAVPQALQMLLFTSATLIDAVMLGQLGEREVGAAGLCDRAMFVLLLVVFGAGNAGGVLAAQYWGAGDGAGLRRVTALTSLMTTLVGALAASFFLSSSHWVVSLGSRDAEVVELGSRFLAIVGLSMVGSGILIPLDVALRTIDRAGIPTRYGVIETLLNIGLNYCLIFGNFGFPALGMEGAAWGTLIARSTRVVLLLAHVHLFEPAVAFGFADLRRGLEREEFRRYFALALPLVLNLVVFATGVFTLQLIYGRLGVPELAVTSVLATFQRFVIAISTAIAGATGILVGRAIGADRPEDAATIAFHSIRVSLGFGLIVALGLFAARDPVLSLFGGMNAATLVLAHTVYPLMVFDVIVRSVNVVTIVGGLKAGGDVRFCLALDFFCAWVIAIPLTALGAFEWHLGLFVVYALAMSEESVKLGIALRRLMQRTWMKKLIAAPALAAER
jgi:putative MATE family efflux protein